MSIEAWVTPSLFLLRAFTTFTPNRSRNLLKGKQNHKDQKGNRNLSFKIKVQSGTRSGMLPLHLASQYLHIYISFEIPWQENINRLNCLQHAESTFTKTRTYFPTYRVVTVQDTIQREIELSRYVTLHINTVAPQSTVRNIPKNFSFSEGSRKSFWCSYVTQLRHKLQAACTYCRSTTQLPNIKFHLVLK